MTTVAPRAPAAAAPAAARLELGRIPELVLASGVGLALVSAGNALSRTGGARAHTLWWLGVLLVFAPILARLLASRPSRGERIALVVLLGVALYAVKVMRDPFAFTFADELVHQHNADEIAASGQLFGGNAILPVTPHYPGLELATAALASLTGASTFATGLIVVGIARAILMLALFGLLEAITGSARVAGVATALYATTPNFLYFSAQFSYESLALPLALVAALCVQRADGPAGWRRGWAAAAALAIAAVVVTHHMTSYALAVFLVASCLVPMPWLGEPRRRPWPFAVLAVSAALGWLFVVADATVGYLAPVLGSALAATFETAAGQSAPRELFASSAGSPPPPLVERLVGIEGILLIVAAIPFGLMALWRRHRDVPAAIVLALACAAYVGTLALRVVPAAWETATRASEFLYVGVALTIALAAIAAVDRDRRTLAVVVAAGSVAFMGGVISAWPSAVRLAQPYRVTADGATLSSPPVDLARWSRELGPAPRIAAEEADARVLLADGRQRVFAGIHPDVVDILHAPALEPWHLELFREQRIRYVAVDARRASADVLAGYFFPVRGRWTAERFPFEVVDKLDAAAAPRVFDNGEIVVYDVTGLRDAR